MAHDVSNQHDQDMVTLLKDTVEDVQKLARQHLQLFREEIKRDIHQAREGAVYTGVGAGIALVGGLLLGVMLAEWLLWVFPDLARWVAYGVVGVIVAVAGGVLLGFAMKKFQQAATVSEPTKETVREDVEEFSK